MREELIETRVAPEVPVLQRAREEAGLSVGEPGPEGAAEPDEAVDPLEDDETQDSWEPPSPALGGPGQLIAAVVSAFVVGLSLLAAVAVLAWLLRLH